MKVSWVYVDGVVRRLCRQGDDAMLDDLQRAAFEYFVQSAAQHEGMVADTSRRGVSCLHRKTRIRTRGFTRYKWRAGR